MVETVKRDKEVTIGYMKTFEKEQFLLDQGREEGRKAERANTERARKMAARERKRAEAAKEEIRLLREEIKRLKER